MLDPIEPVPVLVQPGERADRAGGEQEAVGVPQPALQQAFASIVATAMPERLSLASEGWQT